MNRTERNRVVLENLPLVGYLVADACNRAGHRSRDDLASAGALGLIAAADAFDPSRGVPFGAFARFRINGAITDELRKNDWATRSARRRIRETLEVKDTLTNALGREPEVAELAEALGVEHAEAEAALTDAARSVTHLDDLTAEFLEATADTPEQVVLAAENIGYLHAAIAVLPEKMRYIIEQIYLEDRSVNDVAEELGTSHSAVSQQRSEAIRLLRDGMETNYAETDATVTAVHSRISANRRTSYLTSMAERAAGGFVRHTAPAAALAGIA